MKPSATDVTRTTAHALAANRMMDTLTDSYHRAASAFWHASRTCPHLLIESHYRFADRPVRMRIVGRALAEYWSDAFAHLRTAPLDGETPQLTIDLWDETETGVFSPTSSIPEESTPTWKTGGGLVTACDGGRLLFFQQPAGATWFDRSAQHMVGWRALGEPLAITERSKPLPLLLSIWYYDCGVHVVHAGLVGLQGNGILIGGPSGSGKSTMSLLCFMHGFDYLGDDHIGLSAKADGPFVGYSLYNGARLAPDLLTRLERFKPYAIPSNSTKDDKYLVFMSQISPSQIARAVEVRAIVMPSISRIEQSRIRRATKREAMLRLAPTSFFTPFSSGARGFEQLAQLIDRVPLYWLEMSERLEEVPALVSEILRNTELA